MLFFLPGAAMLANSWHLGWMRHVLLDALTNDAMLFLLVPVWMYELWLGIAHLKFRGPNSAVWMAMEFECGNWPKFRAKSTMCYFGLPYF
jgi:hypothetical protein